MPRHPYEYDVGDGDDEVTDGVQAHAHVMTTMMALMVAVLSLQGL